MFPAVLMREGRAFARRVAVSSMTDTITTSLVDAEEFVIGFVGDRAQTMLPVALAGLEEGRELAAAVAGIPAARELAVVLGRTDAGLDSAVSLALSPVGEASAAWLCGRETGLAYASAAAGGSPGQRAAQYLADSDRALSSFAAASTRIGRTPTEAQRLAATETCATVAAAIMETEPGRRLVGAMHDGEPGRTIIGALELGDADRADGTTAAALAAGCVLLQIAAQYSVLSAAVVLYVAYEASAA